MYYPRSAFKQDGIKIVRGMNNLGPQIPFDVPQLDFPITPLENFRRVANRDNPLWVTNFITDVDSFKIALPGNDMTLPAKDLTQRVEFNDFFGIPYIWVPEAGGAMLKPNTHHISDILNWEKELVFPNVREIDFPKYDNNFMEERYNPDKVMHFNIGQGITERLVAILGGYEEALTSLLIEPEACLAFFDRYTDWMIELFETLYERYPLNWITFHDDWGTERDTFFSPQLMEDMVLEPTRKFLDHVHNKGVAVEHHCCGKIERFLPYMIDLGIEFLQLQDRANDVPALKKKYGDKIGFNVMIPEFPRSVEDLPKYFESMHKTVDTYGMGGGLYTSSSGSPDFEIRWAGIYELFCYSREFYDKEQGRN